MQSQSIDFPEKLAPLFERHRYKVLRGGRASTKSWSTARYLTLRGGQEPIRWLCGREFQSSIRESVHKLLSDQIAAMGLGSRYEIEKQAIYGKRVYDVVENGVKVKKRTEFTFAGLADQTVDSIKSFEAYDGAWMEEAQVMTQRTVDILLPTIRKDGSQIIFTYNPELDTDPIAVFADSLTPADGVVIEMNWRDNPWFNATLEAERQRAKRTMSKVDYENIWEGKCRPAVAGAIYADEVATMFEQGRAGNFGHDPYLVTYPVFDLGWNDKMSIVICQRVASSLRIIDHLEDDHKTYAWYSQELRKKPYNWGTAIMPHDAAKGNPQTGMTDKKVMEGLGWTVDVLPRTDPNTRIRAARMAFEQLYINKPLCPRLLEALKRYRRGIPATTGEPGAPVHDEWSHAADAFGYAAEAAPLMTNGHSLKLPPLKYGPTGVC